MASSVQFETPENVEIAYRPAGLGTRFTAWWADSIFVTLLTIVLTVVGFIVAAAAGVVVQNLDRKLGLADSQGPREFPLYFFAVIWLLWGLGSFLYFTLFELFGRGQTIGKRICRIRVVKADGFALDAAGILVRNVLRLVDQIPPLWIVPLLSARSQRFGDMAGGTLVVAEPEETLGGLRSALLARPVLENKFRFDGAILTRATPLDIEAAERILERWPELRAQERAVLLERIVEPLSRRLGIPAPDVADRLEFLQDFLAAVYRREMRRLG